MTNLNARNAVRESFSDAIRFLHFQNFSLRSFRKVAVNRSKGSSLTESVIRGLQDKQL